MVVTGGSTPVLHHGRPRATTGIPGAGNWRRLMAVDRATRWVFVRIYPAKSAANARRFLRDLERAAPMTITRVLTHNGVDFHPELNRI